MEELDEALAELRELARGIHPAVLADRGLEPALSALAGRAPLPVRSTWARPSERLPAPVEAAAYFVVAEALTNVAKYAHAHQASVAVERRNGHAVVEVRDDGVGGADPARGSGLTGLADRLERARRPARDRVAGRRRNARAGETSRARSRRRRLRAAARGRRARCSRTPGFDVVAQAGDADDLVRKVGAHKPDVAIVDVRMPPDNTDDGLRAAIKPARRAPRPAACSSCPSTSSPTTRRRCWPTDAAGRRLPAEGPRRRRRAVHRRGPARRGRRVGARPRGRLPPRRPQPRGRPARAAHAARARGARADGRGPLERRDRGGVRRLRARGREARDEHLRKARPGARAGGPPARAGRARVPARRSRLPLRRGCG